MMSMVSRLSVMSFDIFLITDHRAPDSSLVEGVDDAERRGMKGADGAQGVDDVGGVVGVNDAGRDAARANQIDGTVRG